MLQILFEAGMASLQKLQCCIINRPSFTALPATSFHFQGIVWFSSKKVAWTSIIHNASHKKLIKQTSSTRSVMILLDHATASACLLVSRA